MLNMHHNDDVVVVVVVVVDDDTVVVVDVVVAMDHFPVPKMINRQTCMCVACIVASRKQIFKVFSPSSMSYSSLYAKNDFGSTTKMC